MSFEGFYQLLCEHGHHWTEQCVGFDDASDYNCPVCKGKPVWWNIVDQTNGMCDQAFVTCGKTNHEDCENCNDRIDNIIFLEVDQEKSCKHCNTILERIYKIPKGKGHKV